MANMPTPSRNRRGPAQPEIAVEPEVLNLPPDADEGDPDAEAYRTQSSEKLVARAEAALLVLSAPADEEDESDDEDDEEDEKPAEEPSLEAQMLAARAAAETEAASNAAAAAAAAEKLREPVTTSHSWLTMIDTEDFIAPDTQTGMDALKALKAIMPAAVYEAALAAAQAQVATISLVDEFYAHSPEAYSLKQMRVQLTAALGLLDADNARFAASFNSREGATSQVEYVAGVFAPAGTHAVTQPTQRGPGRPRSTGAPSPTSTGSASGGSATGKRDAKEARPTDTQLEAYYRQAGYRNWGVKFVKSTSNGGETTYYSAKLQPDGSLLYAQGIFDGVNAIRPVANGLTFSSFSAISQHIWATSRNGWNDVRFQKVTGGNQWYDNGDQTLLNNVRAWAAASGIA